MKVFEARLFSNKNFWMCLPKCSHSTSTSTCILTIGGYVCFLRARLLKQNSPHYCILISFLFRWPIFLTYENKPLPADTDREHFTRPVLLGRYAAYEHPPSRVLDLLQDNTDANEDNDRCTWAILGCASCPASASETSIVLVLSNTPRTAPA